jgi:hypothetical protein
MPCNVDTYVQYPRSFHFAVASESDGKAGTVPAPRPILIQTPQYLLYKNSHKFDTFKSASDTVDPSHAARGSSRRVSVDATDDNFLVTKPRWNSSITEL